MGSLMLPSGGSVSIDTVSLIYSVETQQPFWNLLKPLWQAARSRPLVLVSSELTLLEALVGPLKRHDDLLTLAYEQVFESPEVRLIPITPPVLREAARLRASIPGLRTPDALHTATAMQAQCVMFLSNDMGFRRVPSLPLVVLSDVLEA